MWTDSIDCKTAYRYWYRGRRVALRGRYKTISAYWRRTWTPPRGTEAWFQIVRGFNGISF